MSSKVWGVSSGCYSDYRVSRIFSTEEMAKEFIKNADQSEWSVEEFALDDLSDPPTAYTRIILDGNTGDRLDSHYMEYHSDDSFEAGESWRWRDRLLFTTYIKGNDLDRATKVAGERLAAYKVQFGTPEVKND